MDGYWDATDDGYTVAGYLEANVGTDNITSMGADFKFDTVGGTKTTNTQALGLVAWADGGVAASGLNGQRTSCHLAIGQTQTTLWYGNTNQLIPIGTWDHADLPSDQVIHVDVEIDYTAHTVRVVFGDGQTNTWTNPNIVGLAGETFACFESFYNRPATDRRVKILSAYADGDPLLTV